MRCVNGAGRSSFVGAPGSNKSVSQWICTGPDGFGDHGKGCGEGFTFEKGGRDVGQFFRKGKR